LGSQPLTAILLAEVPEPAQSRLRAFCSLEAALSRVLMEAQPLRGDLGIPEEELVRFIGERIAPDARCETALSQEHAADLVLCCGCLRHDPLALDRFEKGFLAEVPRWVARLNMPPALVDEVMQVLRDVLFVVRPGRRPRIAEYSGRGSLRGWLKVVSLREAIRILEGQRPGSVDLEAVLEKAPLGDDPELRYVKRLYGERFRAAFAQAFGELNTQERALLGQTYVEGLTIDGLASRLGIHRATAARQLARTRAKLLTETRKRLAHDLRISRDEVDSILRLLDSHLEASVRGLIEPKPCSDPPM
jgi:RNA polymerase sigma-70 factor (ECF subfamily)